MLGNGGQGTTYLTVDKKTGEQAVLKQIFCSGLPETNRAIEEAMVLSRLKHERVVSYSEVFLGNDPKRGNYVGIIMEFCAGGDLYQMLCKQRNKRKPISVRRIRMWILQMAEATSPPLCCLLHRATPPARCPDLSPSPAGPRVPPRPESHPSRHEGPCSPPGAHTSKAFRQEEC